MTKQVFTYLLLVFIIIPSFLFAQSKDSIKTMSLKEVSIFDTIKIGYQTKESSSSINNSIIKKIQSSSIGDIAKYIAGVSVKDYGGIGGLKTISVRGLGSQNSAIIYDGISVSDFQTGQVDLSKFSSNNIKEINLCNGQSYSLLQTARALSSANVFLIETLKPVFDSSEKHKTELKGTYGSFNYANFGLNTAYKLNDIFTTQLDLDINNSAGNYPYLLNYGYNSNDSTSKEKRKNSDYFGFRGEWNSFANINNNTDLKFKVYYFYSNRGLPRSTTLYYLNSNQRLWDENFFIQSILTHKFNEELEYRNHIKAQYSYTHYFDSKALNYLGYQSDKYFQREYYINNVASYKILKNLSSSLSNDVFYNNLNSKNLYYNSPQRLSSLTAFTILFDNSHLLINANILHSYIQDYPSINSSPNIRNHFSPFISLGYTWDNYFTLSCFYKDVFRMPTFNDLYFNRVSESNLNPEKAKQFNIHASISHYFGIYRTSNLTLSIDAYRNIIKDKLIAIPQRNLFIWSIINYGQVKINGIDIQTMFRVYLPYSLDLTLRATYSYQDAVDITDKTSQTYNNQIPYTPINSGSLFLNITNPFIDIAYTINFVGKRFALAENIDRNLLKPYQDHSLTISKDFYLNKHKINIGLSCLNLFGNQYEVVRNYPMPQRQFRINLKTNL